MPMLRRFSPFLLLVLCPVPSFLAAQAAPAAYAAPAAEVEAVRRAALDYLEGFYEGDSTKFVASVRPEFYKYGFWWPRNGTRYEGERMSWQEALDYIRGVREKKNFPPATAPKEVQVFEVLDQTAAVKVRAWWGSDYLLLGKYDGRWMISHVMWQSAPR